MGVSKSDFFTAEQNELAQLFKALAHPARVAIIDYLLKVDSCICNDIVEELPLAQPTISQHLKELRNIGIIKGNIEGTSVCYCIDENHRKTNLVDHFIVHSSNQLNYVSCGLGRNLT